MMRVVLDANVLVSGIVSAQGAPGRILNAWREERFQLLTSTAILAEVARVLRYPKIVKYHGWADAEIDSFLQTLASLSIRTPGKLTLSVIAEDPADNRYLECAVEGSADYVVSGDRDLLTLGTYQGIALVTPAAFLKELGNLNS
jgi:putative PIN family toxin of toxin-antitoxin system